jgi:hypothetical protein
MGHFKWKSDYGWFILFAGYTISYSLVNLFTPNGYFDRNDVRWTMIEPGCF